ncbi:MAG TPA: hypothetical protein VI386_24840 [Candidatus Sulfotelmatobacter sp.]
MSLFTKFKYALDLSVATCISLTEVIKAQTEAIRAQNINLVEIHRVLKEMSELKNPIASIEKNAKYLATSERHSLQRAGHTHDF